MGFKLVDEIAHDEPAPSVAARPATQQQSSRVAIEMLQIALGALSQRMLVALASLFTLLTVGSAFYLWLLTPDPSVQQIVSLSIYSVFIVVINYLNMRRKS